MENFGIKGRIQTFKLSLMTTVYDKKKGEINEKKIPKKYNKMEQ